MLEMFIDFLADVILQGLIGLPALPKNSDQWKKRRTYFLIWFGVAVIFVAAVASITILNVYGIL